MAQCWTQRGCDAEMSAVCPHAIASEDKVCVAECYYTHCTKPTRVFATDLEVLLDPAVDRTQAVKEVCRTCTYFLTTAPRQQVDKCS